MASRSRYLAAFLAVAAVLVSSQSARAGSATWLESPASGDWNTAANWMPNTVPNSPTDIASFGFSGLTNVSLSTLTTVAGVSYQVGASAFTISVSSPQGLVFTGDGIINNSGIIQNFVTNLTNIDNSGAIMFRNNATAGSMTVFTNDASSARLDTARKKSDQVVANGVTIQSGAEFELTTIGDAQLRAGKTFVIVSNTASTPIDGVFANLPDGSILAAGRNNLQVSYAGGDGNDLVLTVVP